MTSNSEPKIYSRKEIIKREKEAGRRVAAVFPIHYPRPLFRAHDIMPVEVWGPPGVDPVKGDTHLQTYTCSIVRHGLSFAMSNAIEDVDLVVVPHCCDTLQGLGSILLGFLPPGKPVFPLYIPRGNRVIDITFLADELRALDVKLSRLCGKKSDVSTLREAIEVEDQASAATRELYRCRREISLSCREFYHLLRSREYTPAEQYVTYVQDALKKTNPNVSRGIPLFMSGVVPEPPELFDALEEMDAFVVGDDFLSTGRRVYPANGNPDPFESMARSILEGPPDSTRGGYFEDRAQFLLDEVHTKQAKGVVFYHAKFCEPEQFYLPALQQALKRSSIPFLSLETDIGMPLSNQTITRLEAFVETIE